MGCIETLYVVFTIIKMCYCVPPSPTDTLMDDVNGIKTSLKHLSGIIDKLNFMYANQIEPRMVSTATTLSGIDSNVRNLQERAHVWDTFQLHVSAWNDQLSTTDRKLDIISKGQEKLFSLDGKINFIANLEYKLDSIFKKLEETEESLSVINKKIEHNHHGDTLFGEFATRGILSTLKLIERKLDKIQLNGQQLNTKQLKQNYEETKGKLTVKCNTPPIVEDLLRDVSSKVDVMFDKISEKDDYSLGEEGEEYIDDQQNSGDIPSELKQDSDVKLLRKVLRRVSQPCKQVNKVLETMYNTIRVVENNTVSLLTKSGNCDGKDSQTIHSSTNQSNYITEFLGSIADNITEYEEKRETSLSSHFSEQRAHFERILKKHLKSNCIHQHYNPNLTSTHSTVPRLKPTPPVTTTDRSYDLTTTPTITFENTTSNLEIQFQHTYACDDFKNISSGVYELAGFIKPGSNMNYFVRYCEVKQDNSWTVIQRRDNFTSLQNFSLSWSEYKNGFGNLYTDFWFGNDYIHRLSQENDLILRIELQDFEGKMSWAEFVNFHVASEEDNYRLSVGGYRGNASDSFSSHNNSLFSTYDRKNDDAPECCPCAQSYGGGWWFNSCFEANLNGVYHRNPYTNEYFRGIIWEHWLGNYSLKKTTMMVRTKTQNDVYKFLSSTEEMPPETTTFPYIEDP